MEFFVFVSNTSAWTYCTAWCVWLSKLSSHVCWLCSSSGWKQDLGPKMQWKHKYCIKAELSTPFSSSVSECSQTFSIPIFRRNKRHQKLSSMQGSWLSFAVPAVSSEAHRAQVWNLYLKSKFSCNYSHSNVFMEYFQCLHIFSATVSTKPHWYHFFSSGKRPLIKYWW